MKNQLSCVLLALSIFSLNALPAQATNKGLGTKKINNYLIINSGQWCFEFPWTGLFCYDLQAQF